MAAGLASSNLDGEILFLSLLESHLSEGTPDITSIRDLMIDRFEIYPLKRGLLSVPPYSQAGGLSFDRETIDAAIERLKNPPKPNGNPRSEQNAAGQPATRPVSK